MPRLTLEKKLSSTNANLVLYPAPSSKPPAVTTLAYGALLKWNVSQRQKFTSEFHMIHAAWHISSTKMYNDFISKKF